MAAPLLFPHVPEWGGPGAAPFFGAASARAAFTPTNVAKRAPFVLLTMLVVQNTVVLAPETS